MDTAEIIWLVVGIVVVVAVIIALMALLRRRKHQQTHRRLERADELRHEAVSRNDDVRLTQERAAATRAEAEAAREQAARAEREAVIADRAAAAAAAQQEDVVRQADRLDPRVDHEADGYQPTTDPLALKDPTASTDTPPTEAQR